VAHVIYLADKSAVVRFLAEPSVEERLTPLINQRMVATCGMVDLEVLYSARNIDDYDRMQLARSGLHRVPITEDVINQALALQRRLAEIGKHRRPIPDLIIAAAALLAPDVTVLHYDADFDIIAEVCELRHEWIVPQGSL
jgi:predicted nucleic acid-binding protein